jgi:hypothetical protein
MGSNKSCRRLSLTVREEHSFRVFEKWVLRGIFRPKRKEVAGVSRKLHNEELHNLYASPNIIRVIRTRRMRWVRHVARMGETIYSYKVLIRKSVGKRPVRRPCRR